MWAYNQAKVNVKQYPNANSLMAAITKVRNDISVGNFQKVCSRFQPRFKAIIAANS